MKTLDTGLKKKLILKTATRRQRLVEQARIEASATRPVRNDLLPELRIETLPVGDILPPRRRTRVKSPAQLERIINSIREFGLVYPLLVDRDNRVVAGEMLLEALKQLGVAEAPCIRLEHLSDEQVRTLRVTLNRLGETGEWDMPELRLELVELKALDIDLSATGFSLPELDIIMVDDATEESPEEEVEPPAADQVVSRLGDVWQLSDHRVICGDALVEETYTTLLDGRTAQAVFSDPPYNCKIEGFVSGLGKHKHGDFAMAVGEMSASEFGTFLSTYLARCKEHMAAGAVAFACMDWRQVAVLVAAGQASALNLINMTIWNKGSGGMGGLYRSAHELIAVFCKGQSPAINNVQLGKHGRDRTNVWTYPGANRRGSSASKALADHPTPKPVELVVDALLDVTNRGGLVLDPFLGSGTTIIAAEKSGRVGCGIELEPAYIDVCVARWQQMTGQQAVHAVSGRTFAEERQARLPDEYKPQDDNAIACN